MSFVEDSYSKSGTRSAETNPQETLELSDTVKGHQEPEISCTGATYGSEVVEGLEVQIGKKILGTEGRPDFDKNLRLEHKSNYSIQTRNYGATHKENNNNRYEPEPDY